MTIPDMFVNVIFVIFQKLGDGALPTKMHSKQDKSESNAAASNTKSLSLGVSPQANDSLSMMARKSITPSVVVPKASSNIVGLDRIIMFLPLSPMPPLHYLQDLDLSNLNC